MSDKQKTLKTISIIKLVLGLLYIVEGFIVTTGKAPYFIAAVLTIVTAVFCYLAVNDSSKAKPATILLWITIVINFAGIIAGFINKAGAANLGLTVLDIIIAAYLIKLLKEIHA